MDDDLEFELKSDIKVDTEGRHILMDAVVQGTKYLFANIYAPNKVQQQSIFSSNANKIIENCAVDLEQKLS